MAAIIDLYIGGGPDDEVTNLPTKFSVEYIQAGGGVGLTTWGGKAGLTTFRGAIQYLYSLISGQSPLKRLAYAQKWTTYILNNIAFLVSFLGQGFQLITVVANPNVLLSIIPRFAVFEAVLEGNIPIIQPGSRFSFPQMLLDDIPNLGAFAFIADEDVEQGSGYIIFTPEFNIPTNFDNANFYRAEDDNFTNNVSQFINSPSYDRALFVRPRLQSSCHECKKCCKCKKCHKCQNKQTDLPYTTTQLLQGMVMALFSTCTDLTQGLISNDEATLLINERIASMAQYEVEGSCRCTNYFDPGTEGDFLLIFCKRYRLETSDCIVAFTFQGVNDFINGSDLRVNNQVIMNASAVPIDENMGDALYSPNNGIFVYADIVSSRVLRTRAEASLPRVVKKSH